MNQERHNVQAVILAGGKGTRLNALCAVRPKALVPVAGHPFLEWQLEWLTVSGISRVHIAAGYMADSLLDWLRARGEPLEENVHGSLFSVQIGSTINHPPAALRPPATLCVAMRDGAAMRAGRPLTISLSREPVPLGTGGGLKYVEPWIESDPFLVLNGDSLLPNLDFPMLGKKASVFSNDWKTKGVGFPTSCPPEPWRRRIGKLPPAVLAVARIEEAGRYGTVEFDEAGRVTAFREKAKREEGWVNGGVYLIPRVLLAALDPERPLSLETDVFPELARQGRLLAFPAPPPLLDMGTPEGLSAMESFIAVSGGLLPT